MKKILTVAGLCAALTIPASAGATSLDSGDAATRGGAVTLSFQVLKSPNGKPIEVRRFKFSGLLVSCNGGTTATVKGKVGRIDVNSKRIFRHTFRKKGASVKLKGQFNKNGTKASGFFKAKGKFGGQTGCSTQGKVQWRAA